MIVWLLLLVNCVTSVMTVVFMTANQGLAVRAKQLASRDGVTGPALGCMVPVLVLIEKGLWTWYAIVAEDWRFAAIAWVPYAIHMIGKAATKQTRGSS